MTEVLQTPRRFRCGAAASSRPAPARARPGRSPRCTCGWCWATAATQASARPLAPAEILVMTFTRAATRELSDRIRRRLLEAARCFRGEAVARDLATPAGRAAAPHTPTARRARSAAWRLAHGRREHGRRGRAHHRRLVPAHAARTRLRQRLPVRRGTGRQRARDAAEAARDYWRQQLYPLPARGAGRGAGGVERRRCAGRAMRRRCSTVNCRPTPGRAACRTASSAPARRNAALTWRGCKQGWAERAHEMRAWLDAAYDGQAFPFDRRKLTRRTTTPRWLDALAAWADDLQAAHAGPERPVQRASRRQACRRRCKPGAGVATAAALRRLRRN